MENKSLSPFENIPFMEKVIEFQKKQEELANLYQDGEPRDTYPSALLSMKEKDKLDFFDHKVCPHQILKEKTQELLNHIHDPNCAPIISVIGPPRVGKTTMMNKIIGSVFAENEVKMAKDKNLFPITGLEIKPPRQMGFSWKDFYQSGLLAVGENENLINRVLRPTKSPTGYRNTTELAFRSLLLEAIQARQVRHFLCDEAQHLFYVKDILVALEELKSLSNHSKTTFVLFGTYDLVNLLNQNGQLALRSQEVHFRRYYPDSTEDVKNFNDVLGSFQRMLPIKKVPDLVSHSEMFLLGSAGCVGVLKLWLHETLKAALNAEKKVITLKTIRDNAIPPQKLMKLASEIQYGEAFMDKRIGNKEEYTERLRGLFAAPKNNSINITDKQNDPSPSDKPEKKKTRPFTRSLGRDAIGGI